MQGWVKPNERDSKVVLAVVREDIFRFNVYALCWFSIYSVQANCPAFLNHMPVRNHT